MSLLLTLILLAAQADAAACTLPPELAGWPPTSGIQQVGTSFSVLTYDQAATRVLNVPAQARSYGGRAVMASVAGVAPGNYQIAVSSGSWIALVAPDGSLVASTGDGSVPSCGGIAKVLNFTVTAGGRYNVVVAGAATQSIRILVARLP